MQATRPPLSPHRPLAVDQPRRALKESPIVAHEATAPGGSKSPVDISSMIPALPFACGDDHKKMFMETMTQWHDFCRSRGIALDLNADSVKVQYACCVYLVLKAEADAGKPAVESASIGTLLKGLEINVFLFFRIVTQMFQSAGRDAWFRDIFGGDCAQSEKDFRQLEAHFIILVILFAKYRKVYADVCSLTEGEMEGIVKGGGASMHRSLFTSCWKLFLYSVDHEKCTDMIPGFYLLIASLHKAISEAPEAIKRSALAKLPQSGAGGNTTLLGRICANVSAKLDDANQAMERIDAITASLSSSGAITVPAFAAENMEGNQAKLDALLLSVKKSLSAVDGTIMIDNIALVNTSSASPQVVRQPLSSSDNDRAMSPPPSASATAPPPVFKTPERSAGSHMRPIMPATPITSNLNDASWLLGYLEGEKTEPDATLIAYFAACDPSHNPRAAIEQRCKELPRKLELSQAMVDAGIKLYYKSLRAIVKKEEERLKRKDFTDMLNDDAMHHALLAICFEIVVHVYLRLSKPFPAVAQALGVCEFELLVMIENFLRDFEQVLSREVRRHVIQLLNKIVDCNAWKTGSPLISHLADEDNSRYFASVIEACATGLSSSSSGSERVSALPKTPKESPRAGPLKSPGASPRTGPLRIPESPLVVRAAMLPPRHPVKMAPMPPLSIGEGSSSSSSAAHGSAASTSSSAAPVVLPDPAASAPGGSSSSAAASAASASSHAGAFKRQVQKQLSAFGRRLVLRTMDILSELYKYLRNSAGMSHASYERSAHVLIKLLSDAPPRALLHDRHLHQLVMCIIFGACKVEGDTEVTFKRIIAEHRFAFDTGEQIYWIVRVGPSDDQTGNLIEFYNKVFILSCKDVLLQDVPTYIATMLGDSSDVLVSQRLPPASPLGGRRGVVSRTPPTSPLTPRRFVRANVAVSPMRSQQRSQMFMTPRTSRLWTFEQSSIGDLGSDTSTLGKRHATDMMSGGGLAERARKMTAIEDHARSHGIAPMPLADLFKNIKNAASTPPSPGSVFAVPPGVPDSPSKRSKKT